MSTFKVGDLATYRIATDCHGGRIIAVSTSGHRVKFQEDHAKILNGANSDAPDKLHFSPGGFCAHVSGVQRWELTPNPEGRKLDFTRRKRKDGSIVWKCVGIRTDDAGMCLTPGHSHHHDFNF